MRLYHGSNVEIESIDLSKSRPFKDFGRAFYLSADQQQAWERAYAAITMRGITFQYAFCTEAAISKLIKL